MRSDRVKRGVERAAQRALLYSLGLKMYEIDRPWIGIANSWTDVVPGHIWLRELSRTIRDGISSRGATPFEFDSIAICDGLCQGTMGMAYSLPSRELIADSVEAVVEAHAFDGIVLVSSCDKIVPAHLMAAARLNIPSIVVTGGPMMPGHYRGERLTLVDMREAIGRVQEGKLSESELSQVEKSACPGPGSCAMMGTANTMAIAAEALGMSLPGTASAPAQTEEKLSIGRAAGERIVELVSENARPREIMTKPAFENAARVVVAVGGSLNAVLHLIAIAKEAGVHLTFDDFDRLSRETPQICSIKPSGDFTMLDFHQAGGVPAVLCELKGLINPSTLTVSCQKTGSIATKHASVRPEVIRPLFSPHRHEGGIAVLKGNLAPLGSLLKTSALADSMWSGSAPAKVFDALEPAIDWLRKARVTEETCIVIRYEGPKGGPGMREMHMITSLIVGRGLAEKVFLVTDGRFSGSTRGPFIGYVCPEAYDGGPIALVEEGDRISYDVEARSIQLDVTPSELSARRERWTRLEKPASGFLRRYRKLVTPASSGATMKYAGPSAREV